jgi:hypothetical protein
MTLVQKMKETPMAPYMGIMDNMTGSQKQTVISYLRYTMMEHAEEEQLEAKRDEKNEKVMLKPNPFKYFKRKEDITEEDRAFMRKKLAEMPRDNEIDGLLEGLTLTHEELQDERTRYILGLDR